MKLDKTLEENSELINKMDNHNNSFTESGIRTNEISRHNKSNESKSFKLHKAAPQLDKVEVFMQRNQQSV